MEIQQLRCFVTVADHGSFSKAAQVLGLSQPSLSQAVGRLETEFETQVFHRVARGVTLTSAGTALLPAARKVLQAVSNTQATVDGLHGLTQGELSLVTFSTFTRPASDVIAKFRARYPGVRLRVHDPVDAETVFALVDSGACEIGFALFFEGAGILDRYPGVELHPLAVDESVVLVPRESDLGRSGRPVGFEDISTLPLIAPPPGHSGRIQLERSFTENGARQPDVAVVCTDHETSVELVARGVGAYLTTRGHLEASLTEGVRIRAIQPRRHWPIGLVHRTDPLSPAAAALKEVALVHFADSIDRASRLFSEVRAATAASESRVAGAGPIPLDPASV